MSRYRRSLTVGVLIGTSVGLIVALVMSYADWRLNPDGIFHDDMATNWDIVFETAISWFVPVALIVTIISITILSWLSRR